MIYCLLPYRGTIEDTEMVDGLVLNHRISHFAEGVGRVEKAKIGLLQFCISPPKTDMENNVIVSDYTQMDRVLREERQYILDICKKIKKSGCNVVLLQKSILRYVGWAFSYTEVNIHLTGKLRKQFPCQYFIKVLYLACADCKIIAKCAGIKY